MEIMFLLVCCDQFKVPGCLIRSAAKQQDDGGWPTALFRSTTDVNHPGSQPLTDVQIASLETSRSKLESRNRSHGMRAGDVQNFINETKRNPEVSTAQLDEIRREVGQLMQGQRVSFDFD